MRLADEPSTLQLGGKIAVRDRLIAQQAPRVVDEKSRRIEHDENFGDQRLGQRFAGFARDGGRDFGFPGVQLGLKLAQHGDSAPESKSQPTQPGPRGPAATAAKTSLSPAHASSRKTSPVAGFTDAILRAGICRSVAMKKSYSVKESSVRWISAVALTADLQRQKPLTAEFAEQIRRGR